MALLTALVLAVAVSSSSASPTSKTDNSPPPPPGWQCARQLLAWDFAKFLQPHRGWSGADSGAAAVARGLTFDLAKGLPSCPSAFGQPLDGRHLSKTTPARPARDAGWSASVPPLPEPDGSASTLYVDFSKGADSAAGTEAAPLKTIAKAVEKAAALPKPRTILLRAGTHMLSASVVLTPAHSELTIRPYRAEEAVVSGGLPLNNLQWTKGKALADGAHIYTAKLSLPAALASRGTPFLELFNSTNARLIPARSPNGNVEANTANYKAHASSWLPNRKWKRNATIIHNASYSRGGMWFDYQVGVNGSGAENFEPMQSFWATPASDRAGGGALYQIPSGFVADPQTDTSNASLLKPGNGGGFAFMMQSHSWGSWVYELSELSRNGSGFTTLKFGAGGQQEARGNGGAGGGSFYLSHRLELLDCEDEWYFDAATSTLHLGVAGGQQPPTALVAPVVERLFDVCGTQAAPVQSVRISSLTLRHASPSFMRGYTAPSGGDYSVSRTAAVRLQGTRNASIDHCLLDALGGNGVALIDFNRNASVSANEMRLLGENGVILVGSTDWVDGRGGDQPRFNAVSENLIYQFGLYTKQSCAVLSAVACQNTIERNVLFHGPRALININDGFGGGTIVRQNLLFLSVMETGDHGPFNCWDRLPYLTNVRTGSPSLVLAFNHLVQNLFLPASEPYPLDTDDGCNQVNASSNVVFNALWKYDFGGHSKHYSDNVVFFPYSPGWAGGGIAPETGDPTNLFSRNKVYGMRSHINCANASATCRCACQKQAKSCPAFHNCTCACPAAATAHNTPPGNASSCAIAAGNNYFLPGAPPAPGVQNGAVCPKGSRLEAGSVYHSGPMPGTAALVATAKAALGMPATHDSEE